MGSRLIELDRQQDLEEIGGTFVENAACVPPEERINPYRLNFDVAGIPRFPFEVETVMGKAEYNGMKSIWELAKDGYQYVFWLSPPGGKSVYTEGRMVVGKVINNDNVEIECRGIVVLESAEKMMEMANELLDRGGMVVDGIRNPEDLREQAIGMNLADGGDLWDFCEEVFGMEKVWKAIRQGDDIKRKTEIVAKAEEAVEKVRTTYGEIDSRNSVMAGAMFEGIMARWGYQIVGGNHGGTNMGAMNGAFGFVFNEGKITRISANGERQSYCEGCRQWYSGNKCPYCNRNN